MKYTLYRNMSREEADKVLSSHTFEKPTNKVYLPRKWFSTSLFRTHYFKSPFYSGPTTILKVEINEPLYQRIFKEGVFLPKEPNGFYGYDESQESILYALAHKGISSLYNIGFLDLPSLNREICNISEIDDEMYCPFLEQTVLGNQLSNLPKTPIEDELDFYLQVPYDIAILFLRYQTFMIEAINPVIKKLHLAKDITELNRQNLNKYTVTLRVRFCKNISNISLFNENFFSLSYENILKISKYITSITLASLEPAKPLKEYLSIAGNNNFTKHEAKPFPQIKSLSFSEFESVTKLLFDNNLSISKLTSIMPFLADVIGVNQVDPRHIDNLETHIIKTIKISNLVINYFKNQGLEIDSETIILVKWLLLLHDLGKPYCECQNITTRYSQFGDKEKYNSLIMEALLDKDFLFTISNINKIFSLSSLTKHKKISRVIKEIINNIINRYKIPKEEAYNILNKYLKVCLIAKVTHSASLKTRSFCCNYVDDIMFFDRISEVLLKESNSFAFPYEEYYTGVNTSYEDIIESFYLEKPQRSVLDILRNLPQQDYNDLTSSFNNKINALKDPLIEEQLCYDEIISLYFKDDNPHLLKYFTHPLCDKSAHGDSHSARVLTFSYLLGKLYSLCDEDLTILAEASLYHDIGRNISKENHSLASINILKSNNSINSKIKEYVYFLIEAHGYDDKNDSHIIEKYQVDKNRAMTLLRIFKDADALDRLRFDKISSNVFSLNIDYLRTDASKKLIKFASILNASFKINPLELSPSLKELLKR